MTDLIVVSLEDWDEVWRRNQHLVAGLLRSRRVDRVLFVEPGSDPVHALRRRERPRRGRGLQPITDVAGVGADRIWAYQPTKWLPRKFDPNSDARWASEIRRQVKEFDFANPVLWVNDPLGAELLSTGWPALYDITDDWLLADRPAPELARLRRQEDRLLTACREVVVCSPALSRTKSVQRAVTLIPNAVDLDPYRTRQSRPADLPSGPIALYLGTSHRDRLDVELCIATAARLADTGGHVVLIGPAPLPDEDLKRLDRAGAHVLGPRPSASVPTYLQHADVLLVPHVLSDFTASLDPIKAYEYRAARRPVVSTPVPGFVEASDHLVRTVDPEVFAEAVATAIALQVPWSGDLPKDIPSWSQRVKHMAEIISKVEVSH
ncbi:glycosyltransferase family 1 protein [Ornithinimicrobium ciconiae]|uniref:Glycosyltransferase family 1 protein n=1 Tax=Ornithinimicrobium ciconiae TaxID=2594265 RepID=A0A516G7A4_9MICO|nr:glycosyltransferase [Ornithinimicrobium ciconiae]QDO87417.1 glycosyltransferase family 1 protein [Ornithinimicrobium ciconiae]